MADRDIFCCKCGKYVGVIRDARLAKGLKFLCPSCDTKPSNTEPSFTDIFADVFGKNFGKG